ncbi:hypothetical protein K0M31_004484 [Melipona bicolor]|uniref:Uncharacterized protein n=1 Tax=Melipona bicolor TaxID=60889 RepID=A0AA40FWW3_9HYME|nr:hypothetical protein K0M31_004484 [Melipona bicolor]
MDDPEISSTRGKSIIDPSEKLVTRVNKQLCVKRNVSFVDAQRCVKGGNDGEVSLSLFLSFEARRRRTVVEEEGEEERKEGSRWYFAVTRSGEVVQEGD